MTTVIVSLSLDDEQSPAPLKDLSIEPLLPSDSRGGCHHQGRACRRFQHICVALTPLLPLHDRPHCPLTVLRRTVEGGGVRQAARGAELTVHWLAEYPRYRAIVRRPTRHVSLTKRWKLWCFQ